MATRSKNLLALRPEISALKINETMSADELFQNKTLRPIIKLQHNLLIAVFKNYIALRKNVFYNLTLEKQLAYIDNAITKDIKFRNSVKGLIMGQFTVEEYARYTTNASAINKRIMSIIKERLVSNIQVFTVPKD
ncbi:MAG: glyoxalase [Winogradskyella sp.]